MISRRQFCAATAIAALASPHTAFGRIPASSDRLAYLMTRAREGLARHAARVTHRDVVGLVDFGAPSHEPRFHIVDLATGRADSLLVSHGRGSDPDHSGWLQRFSNNPGSNASSSGAYLTGEMYEGRHGPSRRLAGLDDSNSNAEMRAIVIHAADYVSQAMATSAGKIGRSEGCFAVAPKDRRIVLERLGPGRLIYAGKS